MLLDQRDQWLQRLASLRVDRSTNEGPAPHKPLLLFCILDMIDEGQLSSPAVGAEPQLFFRFQVYWEVVRGRRSAKPDMRMPFHALGTDGIWRRYTEDGAPSKSRDTTRRCEIEPELWQLLADRAFRNDCRRVLISSYFPDDESVALRARMDLPEAAFEVVRDRSPSEYRVRLRQGRDMRFRVRVLLNYEFTCALTGYSLTIEADNIVQAAHIHRHSDSGNDDPRNGMALTPDAHWAFDQGLWTAEPANGGYRVRVARSRFTERSPFDRFAGYHGMQLRMPRDTTQQPDAACFRWHRDTVYRGD